MPGDQRVTADALHILGDAFGVVFKSVPMDVTSGHRAAAMHAVEKAGKLLGLDLKGDDKDHEKQALSDDRLKEARDLLQKVLGAAEVKAQEKIAKHISAAIKDINVALKIR